jgi:chemotaxis signal transduction protein
MMTTETNVTKAVKANVIAFPARAPLVGGRQLHFLFSVRQVVDVLRQVDFQSITSDQHYIHGLAKWRGRVVPVVCLERCLGLRIVKNGMPHRTIVIRGAKQCDSGDVKDLYAICELGAAVHQFQLPIACKPVTPPKNLPGIDFLKGIYAMDAYLFMVVNIEGILAEFTIGDIKEAAGVI